MAISDLSKYAAEGLGTFFLVMCVGLVKVNAKTFPGQGLEAFGPTAVGFCLMGLVYVFGNISGGHFNPAVTFAAFLQKEIDFKQAIMYLAVQCGCGFGAGILAGWMYGFDNTGVNLKPSVKGFWLGAPIVEFLFTFLLCFVVLNTTMSKTYKEQPNNFYGVAIGFSIIAGGYGGGGVSGGAFNPAVTLGLNFMGLSWGFFWMPIYMACQLAGSILAVCVFHIVRPDSRVTQDDLHGGAHAKSIVDKLMNIFDPEDTTECLGSLFYALCVSLNAMGGSDCLKKPFATGAVFSNTASFICLYLALGDISGGLFNPAITIACLGRYFETGMGFGKDKLTDPKVSAKEGPKYLIAQFIGAAAGAALCMVIYLCHAGTCYPTPAVGRAHFHFSSFMAELFGTFLLAYVFLGVVTVARPVKEYGAFAIGAVILAGGYAFGPISGGILNPAVTAANSAFHKAQFFYTAAPIMYFLGQCGGGVLAAVAFKFLTHHHEYDAAESGYTNLA